MINKTGIFAIGEKSINILQNLQYSEDISNIAITDNSLIECEESITKVVITSDFNLHEEEITIFFNTYQKTIIVSNLGGEFTSKFLQYFSEKVQNATFIVSEPLKIESRLVKERANSTFVKLKQSENKIILISNQLIQTELIISTNEITAKCNINFYIENDVEGYASSLVEAFSLLDKIISDTVYKQIY